MTIKVTMPNNSSDSVDFINAAGTTLGQVKGYDDGSSNGHLELYTTASGTSTERMRIDSAGNVGIGTSSPSQKLDVAGTTRIANTSGNKIVYVGQSTPSGNDGASLEFQNSSTQKNWAIRSNYNVGGGLEFCPSSAAGGTTYTTPAMTLDSSGNFMVGVTSALAGAYGASFKFSNNVMGIQRSGGTEGTCIGFLNQSGTNTGSIYNFTSSTSYNTTSDYRLKENIAPMTGALAVVQELNPVTYTWKSTGESTQGFIAHELQAIVPECVTGEKDAVDADGNPVYQGIDTSFLVATLTAAIQELSAKNDALEARLAALENK